MATYVEFNDERMLLEGAIVVVDGRLTYVTRIYEGHRMTCVDCETGERFEAKTDLDLIKNPSENRLGYLVYKTNNSRFTVRGATRVYKMGYSPSNLKFLMNGRTYAFQEGFLGAHLEAIHNAYNNIYPSFETAFEMAKEMDGVVAYDRSFAVDNRGKVFYQTYGVGQLNGEHEDQIIWRQAGLMAQMVRGRPQLNWR